MWWIHPAFIFLNSYLSAERWSLSSGQWSSFHYGFLNLCMFGSLYQKQTQQRMIILNICSCLYAHTLLTEGCTELPQPGSIRWCMSDYVIQFVFLFKGWNNPSATDQIINYLLRCYSVWAFKSFKAESNFPYKDNFWCFDIRPSESLFKHSQQHIDLIPQLNNKSFDCLWVEKFGCKTLIYF